MRRGGFGGFKSPSPTTSHETNRQEEAWEEKRDAFNEATVDGVAKILPPGEAARIGFTDIFIELMEQDFDKAK